MDEMRIASKFMTRILSKILAVGIKKCCGVKVKIDLSNVAYIYNEGQMVSIHVKDFDMKMTSQDLEKLVMGKLGIEDGE